jgi:hypothetical protein
MDKPETPWQDLIPPDDPRYRTWLIVRGFIQAGESAAKIRAFEAYAESGTFEIEDLVEFATRLFDSGAYPVVAANSRGVVAAEKCGGILAEMAGVLISHFASLPPYKMLPRSIARDLDERLENSLMSRVESWKAEALRIGVQFELAEAHKPATSTIVPSAGPPMLADPVHEEISPVERATAEQPAATLTGDDQPKGACRGLQLDLVAAERTVLLTEFKARGRAVGIRITDEMVAKAANPGKWSDRTLVAWWKRNDKNSTPGHDKKIRAVLNQNPASIWPKH